MGIANPLHPLNPINQVEPKQYRSYAHQFVDTDIPVTDADMDSFDVALGTALLCTVILGLIIGRNLRRW